MTPMWTSLWAIGCTWISPAEHKDNQARLDADTDVTTDQDHDTGHTGTVTPGCVEDADEPNDTYTSATDVEPGTFDAASCGGNVDFWSLAVADPSDVYSARLVCEGAAVLRIFRDGVLGVSNPDACGTTTRLGLGAGTYTVSVTPTGDLGDYVLELELTECPFDGDGDGQPSDSCPGGGDCDDGFNRTYRGAPDDPTTPADEDCDGLNDKAVETSPACNPDITAASVDAPPVPELLCGAVDVDPVWHHFTFDAGMQLRVDLFLTPTAGDGDLFAYYVDDSGSYGLDPGEDELDSEASCQPSSFGDCPLTCVTGDGDAHLWVAQRDCTGPMEYELRLSVDGGGSAPPVTLDVDVAGPG